MGISKDKVKEARDAFLNESLDEGEPIPFVGWVWHNDDTETKEPHTYNPLTDGQ